MQKNTMIFLKPKNLSIIIFKNQELFLKLTDRAEILYDYAWV